MRSAPADATPWWGDPLAWVELFAVNNVAFLAVDIGLAHSVNEFRHPAEWVPLGFSAAATVLLLVGMAAGGLRPPPRPGDPAAGRRLNRGLGLLVGFGSVLVGVAGLLFHLDSAFFEEQTVKNLVYTAPFAAPLAYAGVGLLLVLDRTTDARSAEWAWWVVLLALGGFVGNYVLTLADHAQNGFFSPEEWAGVIAGAWGVSALVAVLWVSDNRPLLGLAGGVMGLEAVVGLAGFAYHLAANATAYRVARHRDPAAFFYVYGAPAFAPLLFDDLALLAVLGLWALARARNRATAPAVPGEPAPPWTAPGPLA